MGVDYLNYPMREDQTEVLVVGAGPVGLLTALLVAEAGMDVRIIDREPRTTTRSYACALHPRVLGLLKRVGVEEAVLGQGRQVKRMAFYDGLTRRAEISVSPAPYLVILPQSALEGALEQRLREKFKVAVDWNHRFADFREEAGSLMIEVEELGGTGTGYIVPHWENLVRRNLNVRSQFLVGGDGHNSLVRQRLGIEYARLAGPEFFAAYEFESDTPIDEEVRVVLDDSSTNVLWPLPGNKNRWTFQVNRAELAAEFPEKERRSVRFEQKTVDERIRQYVQKACGQRAPWFTAGVREVTWCTEVFFEARLAKQFGRDRCWLAGDAAHQTGPVGAQSMNVGMLEAEALAQGLRQVLRAGEPVSSLAGYDQECRAQWRRLLGVDGGLKPRKGTAPWVVERRSRLLGCLPASGEDLAPLAGQLGLDV